MYSLSEIDEIKSFEILNFSDCFIALLPESLCPLIAIITITSIVAISIPLPLFGSLAPLMDRLLLSGDKLSSTAKQFFAGNNFHCGCQVR